jgi:hypothetical protein
MNNEQKRRRTRGDVNALFDVIELSVLLAYRRRPATAGRRAERAMVLVVFLLSEPNSIPAMMSLH